MGSKYKSNRNRKRLIIRKRLKKKIKVQFVAIGQQKNPVRNTHFPTNKIKFTNNNKIKGKYKDTYLQQRVYMYMLSSCTKFKFSMRFQNWGEV